MRSIDSAFYRSTRWKQCRASYISHRRSIDGGLCERCKTNPGYIVHHKKHLTIYNLKDDSIALGFDNLEYVCHDCHNQEHFGSSAELKCRFDEKGRPIAITEECSKN